MYRETSSFLLERKGSPDLGKDWIEAGVNLPIEEGATLATEEGRSQVEFENGSVAYQAEHSVLQFKGLKSNSQGTSTTMDTEGGERAGWSGVPDSGRNAGDRGGHNRADGASGAGAGGSVRGWSGIARGGARKRCGIEGLGRMGE
jgi:hypothetical protein